MLDAVGRVQSVDIRVHTPPGYAGGRCDTVARSKQALEGVKFVTRAGVTPVE